MTLLREGNPDCSHQWEYDDEVVLTYPPTFHKICVLCGRVEHEQKETGRSKFWEVYNGFWGTT